MKLRDLFEGEIKIPEKPFHEMSSAFVYWYLAYFKNWIEINLEGKDYSKAKKWIDSVRQKYGAPEISDDDTEIAGNSEYQLIQIKMSANDWPYLDKLKKFYPELKPFVSTILFRIYFKPSTVIPKGTLARYSDGKIAISIPNHYMDAEHLEKGDHYRRAILTRNLERAIGNIRHELTHAVQYEVLSHLHRSQVKSINDLEIDDMSKGEREDLYLLSPIEFDPQIKSAVQLFKGIELYSKSLLNDYDRKKALNYVTGADYRELTADEMQEIGYNKRSKFFQVLQRKDPARWKKAVKLFYQLVGA